MKKSFFIKIFSGYVFIIIILCTLILLFSYTTIEKHYINLLKKDLEDFSLPLIITIVPLLHDNNSDKLKILVEKIGKQTQRRITVILPDGTVVADSEHNPSLMENHRNRPEVVQALSGKTGSAMRYSTTVKEKMLYVGIPITENGETTGILRVSVFLRDIDNLINNLKRKIFFISIIIFILSLIAALFLSRRFSMPVKQLNEAAKRFASGDFNAKVFLKNRDELKELADNYNNMTEKIKLYVENISSQKEELNCIVSSIQQGLMVLNKEGQIILHNQSLQKIIHTPNLTGQFYWQVLKEPRVFDLIQTVQKTKKTFTEEVQINDYYFQLSAVYLPALNETLMVFHDITNIKRMEKIKKDFVANISHELRTPLTAIKGYTETIEGINDENYQYLNIIKRHTDRLINIVEDLLILSELEERGYALETEKVYLNTVVKHVLTIFKSKLAEKGMKISLETEPHFPCIQGDPLKLEQVFINLIDNAIKYTESGEIKIILSKIDRHIKAEIHDTGIGIPEKHISRIFERFYTVDKSHSRRLGGTGLGLSIVKHIVNLHHGSIEVRSTPGVGSTFAIILPINDLLQPSTDN